MDTVFFFRSDYPYTYFSRLCGTNLAFLSLSCVFLSGLNFQGLRTDSLIPPVDREEEQLSDSLRNLIWSVCVARPLFGMPPKKTDRITFIFVVRQMMILVVATRNFEFSQLWSPLLSLMAPPANWISNQSGVRKSTRNKCYGE